MVLICVSMVFLFLSCSSVSVAVMSDFEIDKYMGEWYEIARYDHFFERNLSNVTAKYVLRDDGKVGVTNSGFNTKKQQWSSVDAVAVRTKKPNYLRLYFVPIFGSSYRVAYIDEHYTTALVTGRGKRYLWFLSRTPQLTAAQKEELIEQAKILGFDTSKLLYVDH
ncbi:MAG: lipocalin family protein [Rikenellaceae bacterium]